MGFTLKKGPKQRPGKKGQTVHQNTPFKTPVQGELLKGKPVVLKTQPMAVSTGWISQ